MSHQREEGPGDEEGGGEGVDALHETLQCPAAHCLRLRLPPTFIVRWGPRPAKPRPDPALSLGVWTTVNFMVFSPHHRYQEVNTEALGEWLYCSPSRPDKG